MRIDETLVCRCAEFSNGEEGGEGNVKRYGSSRVADCYLARVGVGVVHDCGASEARGGYVVIVIVIVIVSVGVGILVEVGVDGQSAECGLREEFHAAACRVRDCNLSVSFWWFSDGGRNESEVAGVIEGIGSFTV